MPTRNDSFLELAAPGVRALQPYLPGKPVAALEREYGIRNAIKLASNENPFGPSPLAVAAARTAIEDLSRYPEGSSYLLAERLALKHQLDAACITLGNGSNDVLDIIARVFLTPGYEAVFSQHAFAVYPIIVQAVGATARVAPAHDGCHGTAYGHDLAAMYELVGPKTRLVFIANPNNPTGTWLGSAELESFIAALPSHVMVVVDEAYFEYVEQVSYPDTSAWLARFPNLMVTRTFSKAYGLAGLRIGYALSHPEVAALLNRVRQPFNINSVAQAVALAALDDVDYLQQCIRRNREGMAQLVTGFESLGLSYIESVGNFVSFNTGRSGADVYEALLQQGVIVRPVANYGMHEHLRVTVGHTDENDRFLNALEQVLHD
ncbi:MAG: histidinol-phosphate transaminase [Gammaproteobacteria bacterium]|jgi:histidinol-phosphate aminotransferase|nr:histidinol-phosphate transaminase [Gammaproteobacteria bacterium]